MYSRATQDKQAASIQRRLAKKDIRLSQSLAQAANGQAADAVTAEQKMTADVRRKTLLLGSVQKLSSVLGAEERELNMAVAHLNDDSHNQVALRRALPQLHRAEMDLQGKLARVEREEQRVRKGVKTQRAEEKKAKQVLRQSLRADNNYGVRAENAQEKEHFAMSKASLLRAKALVAARKAKLDETTALTDVGKSPAKASKLKMAAENERAAASLLKARAAESIKNAQVWDAKAQEAGSYMKMMKADVHVAEKRVLRKESVQRRRAMYRLKRRQIEQELREAEREERKGDIARAKLLHDAVQSKGIVSIGIKDVQRTRLGLAQALHGVKHAEQQAMLASREAAQDREHVQVDEAQAQSLHFAAAEHQVAGTHLSAGEKAAATQARGLMTRAKDLLGFASEDKLAHEAEQQLRSLDASAGSP